MWPFKKNYEKLDSDGFSEQEKRNMRAREEEKEMAERERRRQENKKREEENKKNEIKNLQTITILPE